MKPKQLKFPFRWEERKPVLEDRVLYVPDYFEQHQAWTFPGWESIFGNTKPVIIEYCSGNGTWIAEKAKDTSCNWVAVEWRFERVRKIWSKGKNYGLSNLFIVCGEAQTFTREYLPAGCIDGVFVNFPDPWPKLKHAKNRLFQKPFIDQLARVMKPNAPITVVTDDPPYSLQIADVLLSQPLKPVFPAPYYVTEWKNYGASYFDSLWREKGKQIHYFQFTT